MLRTNIYTSPWNFQLLNHCLQGVSLSGTLNNLFQKLSKPLSGSAERWQVEEKERREEEERELGSQD